MDAIPPASLLEHTGWLRALARSLVADAHLAEDLTQETLARALRAAPPRLRAPRAWMGRVLGNLVRQHRRRPGPEPLDAAAGYGTESLREAPSTADLVEQAEAQRLLVDAVLDLKEPHRGTLLQRYFEGLTVEEIAAREGLAVPGARSRLKRAHGELRRRLESKELRPWHLALTPLLGTPRASVAAAVTPTLGLITMLAKTSAAIVVGLFALWIWSSFDAEGEVGSDPSPAIESSPDPDELASPSGNGSEGLDGDRRPLDPGANPGDADSTPPQEVASDAPLHGRVLDPGGNPVPDAEVGLGKLGDFSAAERGEPTARWRMTRTREEGRFEFEDLPHGLTGIIARAEGFAASAERSLEVVEGVPQEIDLTLRVGATLTGAVYTGEGTPVPDRDVRLMLQDARHVHYVTTDAEGTFRSEHMVPGTWNLATFPTREEIEARGLDPRTNVSGLFELEQMNLELVDGEERHVEVGLPSSTEVQVRGQVLRDGLGARAFMQWIPEGEDAMNRAKMLSTGDDGRFEVTVESAGTFLVRAMLMGNGKDDGVAEVDLDITDDPDPIEIHVPTAWIEGWVLDGEGSPVADIPVELEWVRVPRPRSPFAVVQDKARTDEEGHYLFGGLPDGEYSVIVTGTAPGGSGPEWSLQRRDGVHIVDGECEEDVDFSLVPGQRVTGRILGTDGLPVPYAAVVAFDGSGQALNPSSERISDEDGRFETDPLAEGTYTLLALHRDRISPFSDPIEVGEDPHGGVDLVLEEGASLRIAGRSTSGSLRAPTPQLLDVEGRNLSSVRNGRDPFHWMRRPHTVRETYVGPLPPGVYGVRIPRANGELGPVTTVELVAGQEQRLEMTAD